MKHQHEFLLEAEKLINGVIHNEYSVEQIQIAVKAHNRGTISIEEVYAVIGQQFSMDFETDLSGLIGCLAADVLEELGLTFEREVQKEKDEKATDSN